MTLGKGEVLLFVVKCAVVIQADLLWQAIMHEGAPQYPLVFFRLGMAGVQASMAVDTDVAIHIQYVDNRYLPNPATVATP